MVKTLSCLLSLLVLPFVHAFAAVPATQYTSSQLQQDVRFIQASIASTHPDLAHSVNVNKLDHAYEEIQKQMTHPMTRDQAWRLLSTLNPLFADGHLAVTQPHWRDQVTAYVKAGGSLFPYEVQVDPAGDVFIRSDGNGAAGGLIGARIMHINGKPAKRISAELLARMHGDTPGFQAQLLSMRWAYFYWKMYGESKQFTLLVKKDGRTMRLHVQGSTAVPSQIADDDDFGKQFQLELLQNKTALLTIKSFLPNDKKAFFDFMEGAFAKIRDARIATLLIDVRDNGGGDDDTWKQGVVRYIADKPFRNGSSYIKKVIQGRQSDTEKLGEVVHGDVDTWIQPEIAHPLHYSGKVYVLVGRHTYSSAVLFANVMQDFGFAKLVGADGVARTRQSGGLQSFTLPHTGLEFAAPRFVLTRPSGLVDPMLIRPDIVLPDSPFASRGLIDALLALPLAAEPSI